MNETFSSNLNFIEAWSRSCGNKCHPIAIEVEGSGKPRKIYAAKTNLGLGLHHISLGPFGLYGSPGWEGQLEIATLENIINKFKKYLTAVFVWNVRFDHQPLADGLNSLGLKYQRTSTHILLLQQNYEAVFANYNSSTRNHIRKANRKGIIVRDAVSIEDVTKYYQIHTELFKQKGINQGINQSGYPFQLLVNLSKIKDSVRLIVAEYEGEIIAGGFFFVDGCSIFYWHGASNRKYSNFYPTCAVFDEAIRWSCDQGATFFNFGASAGISSLEKFKSSWGAKPEMNWEFKWRNPYWQPLSYIKRSILQYAR
jgi:lipid II:glycine glycyltransferase (peptidoglycan interpeptide bridge formation enzyme)